MCCALNTCKILCTSQFKWPYFISFAPPLTIININDLASYGRFYY
jgi:hypothetical protein